MPEEAEAVVHWMPVGVVVVARWMPEEVVAAVRWMPVKVVAVVRWTLAEAAAEGGGYRPRAVEARDEKMEEAVGEPLTRAPWVEEEAEVRQQAEVQDESRSNEAEAEVGQDRGRE